MSLESYPYKNEWKYILGELTFENLSRNEKANINRINQKDANYMKNEFPACLKKYSSLCNYLQYILSQCMKEEPIIMLDSAQLTGYFLTKFLFNEVNTLSEKNRILEQKIDEIHTFMKSVFDATPGQIDYLNAQNRI